MLLFKNKLFKLIVYSKPCGLLGSFQELQNLLGGSGDLASSCWMNLVVLLVIQILHYLKA